MVRELDAVKQEASLLREQMQIVKNDIEKVRSLSFFFVARHLLLIILKLFPSSGVVGTVVLNNIKCVSCT